MFVARGQLAQRIIESTERESGGCWEWLGRWHGRYGQLDFNGRRLLAHRAAYEAFRGEIPAGKIVMHACDNGACVNPAHLKIGTQADNVADMIFKGRARWQDWPLSVESRGAPMFPSDEFRA